MILFSLIYFLLAVIYTFICFIIAYPVYPFIRVFSKRKASNYVHSMAKFWGRGLIKMAFISFDIEGIENYDYKKTYLLTPNHQSAFDIFVCFNIFKKSFAFVSKDTYGKVPLIGFAMSLANYIFVKRGTVGAVKSIDDMENRLRNNISIVIYPEGTRSNTGEIKRPKRGILKIAERCSDIPVLPVVIYGTKDIMKAKTIKITPFKKIYVRFLEPFYFKDIEGDDNSKLDYWYSIMSKNYNELRDKSIKK
ncbi:1-acyl-sn-glycerol-3-phosphate acyltransferase [uncultured Brachyspira sp.]|uniref:lysophospholipid acyltransferase family protein n=1 Tax=uncultured Brachyspira sp. TaxID=221953 RepID=UPI0025FAB579|nr:lysophospholipid acyltransferase family protein [uncultured Brachyspira sp.]